MQDIILLISTITDLIAEIAVMLTTIFAMTIFVTLLSHHIDGLYENGVLQALRSFQVDCNIV